MHFAALSKKQNAARKTSNALQAAESSVIMAEEAKQLRKALSDSVLVIEDVKDETEEIDQRSSMLKDFGKIKSSQKSVKVKTMHLYVLVLLEA